MYYFFKPEILDEKKLMNFTGTMYYEGEKFKEDHFRKGKKIDENRFKKAFVVIVDESDSSYKNRKLTDRVLLTIVHAGPMVLVSPKFMLLLQKLQILNVQFFDVSIKASDFELNNYKLLNVIGKYDCMDEEKSEIRYRSDGKILHLRNLVLDQSRFPENQQIFLLDKFNIAMILVHENLKKELQKEGLTGIEYKILDGR